MRWFVPLCLWLALAGCKSSSEFAAEADEQVYSLIDARRAALFEEDGGFSIEPPVGSLRQRIVAGEVARLDELSLADCMEIAAENHRDYQFRKEQLYIRALDVTLERWRLGWIPNGGGGGDLSGMGLEASSASGEVGAGFTKVLGTGAVLVGDIGLSVFQDLLSGNGWDATSNLSLLFTQPLMRGAGRLIVNEPLTQAERSLVYEVRAFERFRRVLAVDIAAQLLRILQQENTIRNEEQNFESLQAIRLRNEALSEAGRLSDIQVDQASQDELRAVTRLIDVRQDYQAQMDNLKLFLGLPPEVEISIRNGELERLAQTCFDRPELDSLHAVEVALANRPDFLTTVDEVIDAERRSRVSANALEMGLDIVSSVEANSATGQPLKYNFKDVSWSLGLSLDLPVNRLPERNAYRTALITWQRRVRDAALFEDQLAVQLRDELRNLKSRRETFAVQETAVALAGKRVESAQLNQKAGRASTRDFLEAQNALISSQNAEVRALIDYTLARLTLVLDMGLLRVGEDGIRIADAPEVQSLVDDAELEAVKP